MNKQTKTLLGSTAKEAIFRGVNSIFEPTRRTFGPNGRNALIYRTLNRGSRITNDGVTVASIQEPKDPFVNLVANTFKESCEKTNIKVGDGTTLTAIIGGVLYNEIYRIQSENESGIGIETIGAQTLRNNIVESAKKVVADIKKQAKKIKTLEDLEKIAIISVQDEKIGKIIAKMAKQVGVDGYIDVVEGFKGEIETEMTKGFKFPAKVAAGGFVNNPKKYEMIAEDCPVLITNYIFDNMGQISKLLNPFIKENSKLIIIAPSYSGKVLEMMFKSMYTVDQAGNRIKTGTSLYPVAVPSLRTEQFEDLSIYCGAKFIDKNTGTKLQNAKHDDCGTLDKLVVKISELREEATAIGGAGTKLEIIKEKETGFSEGEEKRTKTPIQERIEILKEQQKETKQTQFKLLLERRIASINSSVGIIKVGSSTEANSLYNKHKIEDAVYACKAALRGGYVKGGGLCLKEIADKLPDTDIIKQALLAPYEQIQSSVDGGLDIGEDVIDPAEAIYYAVEHATEVVAQLSTCEILTVEQDEIQMGDGLKMIANQLMEHTIMEKKKEAQFKENEEEEYRDRYNGLTEDEFVNKQENEN